MKNLKIVSDNDLEDWAKEIFKKNSFKMIDVSKKKETFRRALASGKIYVDDEVFEQLRAVGAVPHLWVELNAPHGTIHVAKARKLDVVGAANGFELVTDAQDGVAMAHPYLGFQRNPV